MADDLSQEWVGWRRTEQRPWTPVVSAKTRDGCVTRLLAFLEKEGGDGFYATVRQGWTPTVYTLAKQYRDGVPIAPAQQRPSRPPKRTWYRN
jgi:hypothetical protein